MTAEDKRTMVESLALSALLAVVLGVLLLWILRSRQRHSNLGARLPKGSMGWPIIGESLPFMSDPMAYAYHRIERYGRIFKTSLLYLNCVVCTTPESTKFVMSNSHIFKSSYMASMVKITGERAFLFREAQEHTSMKKLINKYLTPECLRNHVEQIDIMIGKALTAWAERGAILSEEATKTLALDLGMYIVLGISEGTSTEDSKNLLENLKLIGQAIVSTPVDFPGTALHRGLKGRKFVSSYLKNLMDKRRSDGDIAKNDLLRSMLRIQADAQALAEEGAPEFDDDTITGNLVAFLSGSYDTTATSFLWLLKLLGDHPDVLRTVAAEHEAILKSKDPAKESKLTWEDTRQMVYSSKVINEMLRIVPMAFLLVREAAEDVEFDGMLIPKGWTVPVMMSCIHLDPEVFPEPLKFNPSRFDVSPKPYTFLPFGTGSHVCPGIGVAKMVMLIFLHHLTTKFRWEGTAPDRGLVYNCFPKPKGGYPIKILKKSLSKDDDL